VLVGLTSALALVGLGWVAWAAAYQSSPEISSELTSYEVVSDHQATASFRVDRRDTDVRGTCYVRALAEDHSVVGLVTLTVDSGPRSQRLTTDIRTERRATSVEVQGCVAPGQPQRR
jgi:hypothetical protein